MLFVGNISVAHSVPKTYSKYFIAAKKNDRPLKEILQSLDDYTVFYPPLDEFYADPMLFKHQGTNYMFFEIFKYQKKKGVIAYVTIDKDLSFSKPKTVLELSHHASFPYIFEDKGKIYMIPETAALLKLSLYEAVEFPDKWKKKKDLLKRGWYADTILFKHNGYYWIFTAKDSVEDLCIYYSKDLHSKFKSHPINKEKRQGRNAGNIFYQNGKMIRPVMNCGKTGSSYGESVYFKEILELTTTTFVEEQIYEILPTWEPKIDGTHTFNINEDLILYDGRKREVFDIGEEN